LICTQSEIDPLCLRLGLKQLELTLWDKNTPEDGFMGEVLLNVSKLQQIIGKYFEHSFPVKISSVYSSQSREVSGHVLLGLRLDGPAV
jgi:hypothetical protein